MTGPGPTGEDQRDRVPSNTGNLPVPDPTVLTTQLVDRALAAYREVVEVRLNAMDAATHLLANELTLARQKTDASDVRSRDDRDRSIQSLREVLTGDIKNVSDVTGERFNAIDNRFLERDTRTEQADRERRVSLDAALAAAKEAVSEQNKANNDKISTAGEVTQRQIDSILTLMSTSIKALDEKFNDMKGRLDRGEGQTSGATDTRSERRLDVGQALLIASVLAAIAAVVVAVLLRT